MNQDKRLKSMSPDENDFGPEAIDSSIDELSKQKANLEHIKELLLSLEDKADVYVDDADDSNLIHVTVKADRPLDEMKKIAGISQTLIGDTLRPPEIVYNFEDEEYKLDKKFRTKR